MNVKMKNKVGEVICVHEDPKWELIPFNMVNVGQIFFISTQVPNCPIRPVYQCRKIDNKTGRIFAWHNEPHEGSCPFKEDHPVFVSHLCKD